jgi:hypothetical protein
MSHRVDDSAWPLVRLSQTGPRSVEDVRGLTAALAAAVRRAEAEAQPFVVVLDYRGRTAAAPRYDVTVDAFWRTHGGAVGRWCTAMIRLDPDGTATAVHRPGVDPPASGLRRAGARRDGLRRARRRWGAPGRTGDRARHST